MIKRTIYVISLIFGCLLSSLGQAQSSSACIQNYSLNNYVHVSKIDLTCPQIRFVTSLEEDKGLTVSQFAQKYHTTVAINGSFFQKDLTPLGLNITQFRLISKDTRARSFLACNAKNQCYIDGLGSITKANPQWQFALGGWHYYDQKLGKFACAKSDRIGCSQSIFTEKHPRSMVGLDEKRRLLYLVVVEGRQFTYRGMTLDELAALAAELQLTKALNLDGGGSSTMVIHNKRISALPLLQGEERKIANHFGVKE